MLVSNEPGFYKDGEYGIRIESLIMVEEDDKASKSIDNRHELMMKFNTVTMAPIDKRLINIEPAKDGDEKAILNDEEIKWVNEYHKRVYDTLSPLLSGEPDTVKWLEQACSPLKKNEAPGISRRPSSGPNNPNP
jgi:Xaa-Pro aminopeptidase